MQRQHQQLHTHEKILCYELSQKRKLLNELKIELEYCREKWIQAREKNSNTEEQWKQLRTEFASRKVILNDDLNNSGESGYSDEREGSSDDEPGYETDISVSESKPERPVSKNTEKIVESGENTEEDASPVELDGSVEVDKRMDAEIVQDIHEEIGLKDEELEVTIPVVEMLEQTTQEQPVIATEKLPENIVPVDKEVALKLDMENVQDCHEEVIPKEEELKETIPVEKVLEQTVQEEQPTDLTEKASEKTVHKDEEISLSLDMKNVLNVHEGVELKEEELKEEIPADEIVEKNIREHSDVPTDIASGETVPEEMEVPLSLDVENEDIHEEIVLLEKILNVAAPVEEFIAQIVQEQSVVSFETLSEETVQNNIAIPLGERQVVEESLHSANVVQEEMKTDLVEEKTTVVQNEDVSIEETPTSVVASPEIPSTSSNQETEARTKTAEEILEARNERLRRLEAQCKQLVNQVTNTSHRSIEICSRLDTLHEQYGNDSSASSSEVSNNSIALEATSNPEIPHPDSSENDTQ